MWIIIKSSSSTHLKWDPWWVSLADEQVSFLTKIESALIHGIFLYQYRLYFSKERNLPAGQRYPPWGPLEMSKRRRFSPIFLGENSLSINSTLNVLYDDLFFLQSGQTLLFLQFYFWLFQCHRLLQCYFKKYHEHPCNAVPFIIKAL